LSELLANRENALQDAISKDVENTDREIAKMEDVQNGFNRDDKAEETTALTPSDLDNLKKTLDIDGYYINRHTEVNKVSSYRPFPADNSIVVRASQTQQMLKNLLASKNRKPRTGRREGHIDPNLLGRFVVRGSDFMKVDGKPYKTDACCYILKDHSGSMWGLKEEFAISALAEMEEIFKSIMPLKMTSFDMCNFRVIKDWTDLDNDRSYATSFHKAGNEPDGGNNDSLAIACATSQLLKRREKNKLLITVSDGLPPSTEEVKKVVRWSRDQGIFVIGVMIAEDEYAYERYREQFLGMYEKYCIVCSPEKLGSYLVDYTRKFLNL
jgi:nitric oxide reductase activation protein